MTELTVEADNTAYVGRRARLVSLSGRAALALENRGQLFGEEGLEHRLLVTADGDDRVENHGLFAGTLDLGAGTNRVVNAAGALWQSGAATMGGTLSLATTSAALIRPGHHRSAILSSASARDDGAALTVRPSFFVDYSTVAGALGYGVNYEVDFRPDWLGGNLRLVGAHINALQSAGSNAAYAELVSELVYTADAEWVRGTYEALSPEYYAYEEAQFLRGAQSFIDSLVACRGNDGNRRADDRGSCLWVELSQSGEHIRMGDD